MSWDSVDDLNLYGSSVSLRQPLSSGLNVSALHSSSVRAMCGPSHHTEEKLVHNRTGI